MASDRARYAVLALTWVLLGTTSAHAAVVAMMRPPQTPQLTEAMSRLHGELLSVGLDVVIVERSEVLAAGPIGSQAWFDRLNNDSRVDAAIAIEGEEVPIAVDVWVFERSPKRLARSRVILEVNTSNASELLAIRAVEVLRSTFLENEMTAGQKSSRRHQRLVTAPVTALPSSEPAQTTRSPERAFGVAMGAQAQFSLGGVGPVVSPLARFDVQVHRRFALQATLAGLGTRPTITTSVGSARVAQQLGLVGGSYRFVAGRPIWPFAAISVGVLRTAVEGEALSPKVGHSVHQWSALLEACLGSGLRISERFYSTIGLHVQTAIPYVAIHFVDATVAKTGHPNLALSLSMGAWL